MDAKTITPPKINKLTSLSRLVSAYPISTAGLIQYAEHGGLNDNLVEFLRLFPEEMVFETKDDFMNRSRLLAELMSEFDKCPREQLRSPQE